VGIFINKENFYINFVHTTPVVSA